MRTSPFAELGARLTSLIKGFACRLSKTKIRISPNIRTTTREKGNDFQGWAVYTDGGTCVSEGKTVAGWGAVARSPGGRMSVMFGPVSTTEAHLAYAGARLHSNNTVELSSIIEALSCLGPNGPVAPRFTSLCLLRLRARGQHLLGYDSVTRECLLGFDTPSLIKAANHYAAHLHQEEEVQR